MIDLGRVRELFDARFPGYSLPQEFYTDPEIFEFDLEAIHARSWIFIGLEAEIPSAGSYLATTIGRSPIVVVRDRDGTLRGFYNTCRHRGAQICETGHGCKPVLVCPYHQWSYRLDGSLQGTPRMHESFDPAGIHLLPIHVETVAGTVYVCLADEPPPFEKFRSEVEPLLAPSRLIDAKLVYEKTVIERANWKLAMENASECYHCAVGHPSLTASAYPLATRRDLDRWNMACDEFTSRMTAAGVPSGQVDGEWFTAFRFPLKEGCVSLTMDGKPSVRKLFTDNIGWMRWSLHSSAYAHALCDYTATFTAMPIGVQETAVTWKIYVHKDAQEGADYTLDSLTPLWDKTNFEDRDLAEMNQRGVNGKGYLPGPYSQEAELYALNFVDWYCAQGRAHLDPQTKKAGSTLRSVMA
ncbi:Rieske 2Fe-2S family protein [Mesorhizobium shonense]|uniref:Rieske 2Fe-2S family protein n=1 Tax=Mesorhizobium shonense TaxID=1209948 RepID=A0ABV2HWU2_9HYPH